MTEMAFDETLGALSPDDLAGWAAAVVWEPRPQDTSLPRTAPGWLAAAQLATDGIVPHAVRRPPAPRPGRGPRPAVQRWAAGEDCKTYCGPTPWKPAISAPCAARRWTCCGRWSPPAGCPTLRAQRPAAIAAVERDMVRAAGF